MKKLVSYLVLLCICTHISFAGYSDGFITAGEYEYDVWLENYDELVVMGGGADRIIVKDNSYLEVRYTSVPINGNWHTGGITSLLIDDFSELTFLDGTTDLISIYDRATATLKGGSINMIRSFQFVGSVGHIDLECQEGWSWVYNSGQIKGITGLWENNTPFDIEFLDQGSGYAPVWQNINVIPEPVTLVLFGLGGLLIRRKR